MNLRMEDIKSIRGRFLHPSTMFIVWMCGLPNNAPFLRLDFNSKKFLLNEFWCMHFVG